MSFAALYEQTPQMNAPTPQHIEAACRMVNQIARGFQGTRASCLSLLATGRELQVAGASEERLPIDDLKTAVMLYTPSLLPHWEAIVVGRDRLGRVFTDLVMATSLDRSLPKPSTTAVNEAFAQADGACDAFLSAAYALARVK